jgi:hypothetical protein
MARKRGRKESGPLAPRAASEDRSRSERTTLRTGLRVLLGLLLAGGLVGGLAWIGRQAGSGVAGRTRYAVEVADILCNAPPGSDRGLFLTEVRYVGGLTEVVQSVEPGLADRLTAAFAAHPWVASVDGVTVTPGGGEIHVGLTFRTPVLAVPVIGDPDRRAVDADGVLLPATAPTAGLAVLTPAVFAPAGPAGQPWDDPDVRRAAGLAAAYKATRVEKTGKGWRLTRPDGTTAVVGS